jgi:RHS repeat-associated protein
VGCRKLPVQDCFQLIENSHTKYRRARFISVTQKASGKITQTTRQGAYFQAPVTVNNASNNVTEELDITAVKFDAAQDKDVVSTITGKYTVQKTPEQFTYDDDGNLLSDGKFTYTWNAENRLVEIHNSSFLIRNSYDYMGRRISKKVYTHNGTTWVLDKEQKFVYNGYKQIASFDSMGNAYVLARTYLWQPTGQDVPLWTKNHTTNAIYIYIEDGNKNIRSMEDINGHEVATYDYTPFGSVSTDRQLTPISRENPFRFSSEYHDDETGLVYYNFRYYSPELGRWLSRDSIGENGGFNLYGYINNDTINKCDKLGMSILLDIATDIAFDGRYYYDLARNDYLRHKENLRKALKALCPKTCCTNLNRKIIKKKDCEKAAESLAVSIANTVFKIRLNQIKTHGKLPTGGWWENIKSKFGGIGVECGDWQEAIQKKANGGGVFDINHHTSYRSVVNSTLYPKKPLKLGWQKEHNWIEIYGPCNKKFTGHGDIIIDPWSDGGSTIIKHSAWDIVETEGDRNHQQSNHLQNQNN